MRYAGPCVGGPDAGVNNVADVTRWPIYKTPFKTMRDIAIAEKVMPDMEIPVQLLGYYVWEAVNELWRWEPAK